MEPESRCSSCMFFCSVDAENVRFVSGQCRRFPPQIARVMDSAANETIDSFEFPVVTRRMWCGEWQPIDEKSEAEEFLEEEGEERSN